MRAYNDLSDNFKKVFFIISMVLSLLFIASFFIVNDKSKMIILFVGIPVIIVTLIQAEIINDGGSSS